VGAVIYREVNRRLAAPEVEALPRGARVLFRALLEKARRDHDGTWVARYGDKALMQRTGYQRTAVIELRRQLEAAGLVVTVEGSGLSTTRYELCEREVASAQA
jgi:hypothetical protein